MSITTLFPLISAIFVFILGVVIFRKNVKSRINSTFFFFCFFITIWMFGTFMMFLNKEYAEEAIFWDKFIYLGVVFIPAVMYHFSLAITKNNSKLSRFISYVGYFISAMFFIAVFGDSFVKDVFIYQWGIHTQAQFLHHIFLIYFFIYICSFFIIVWRYYNITIMALERAQIRYVFLAFFILATIGPLAYLPAYGIGIYPFAYVSGLIFVIILAYAILRYRLMDIKLVLRKGSIFILSIISITVIATLLQYLFFDIFLLPASPSSIITLLLCLALYKYIEKYFYKIANKYFFTSLYDANEVIKSLTDGLSSTIESEKIYKIISESINESLHPKYLAVLILNSDTKKFEVGYAENINLEKSLIEPCSDFIKIFINNPFPLVTEELEQQNIVGYKKLAKRLNICKTAVAIPLKAKNELIGLIILGNKETKDVYGKEDLEMLRIIGRQAVMAIENGLLYNEVMNFNIGLKDKIKKATEKLNVVNVNLQKANKELKQLDQTKSEFISIASHQLRTPLTAIKGYGSMLLDGDFGEVKEERQKEAIRKMFISNNRLINLVENLLNISRIESGRLKFEFKSESLVTLAREIYDNLKQAAEDKGLYLKFIEPQNKLPDVNMDSEKIRQIVINFIDNAIKYTKEGGITVSVFKKDKNIVCCVADTGMGVDKEEQAKLFRKFARGKDAFLVNTEGMGLGLYVAQMMIEAHNGNIWVESGGDEKGSKFCFSIPLEK